jgi:hypothetical protein
MSYHLPSRRPAQPVFAVPAKNFATEVKPGNEVDAAMQAPEAVRMAVRWSAAGARFHARFAETARKTFR